MVSGVFCQPFPPFPTLEPILTFHVPGIGLACAKILPTLGLSHLIITARSLSRGEEAATSLRNAHPYMKIDVWELDMLNYDSIQNLAAKCASLPKLHIAILNAGMYSGAQSKINPATGHEESFQVNYLSTTLLSILLLPVLKAKSPNEEPGKLTVVGSGTGLVADFPNKDEVPLIPSFDKPFNAFNDATARYFLTKLLVMILVAQLGDAVNANDVIVNTVEPGLTAGTGLHRDTTGAGAVQYAIMKRLLARTPEEAAWTYIDAVGKGRDSHGGLILAWKVAPMNYMMYQPEGKRVMKQLWDETLQELNFAGVKEILHMMGGQH